VKSAFEVTTRAIVERAFLVGVSLPQSSVAQEREHLEELEQLAETAGAVVLGRTVQARTRLDGATYVGEGKAREIKQQCEELGANLLIFDDELSPAQARNLEKILGINIIDRTELILDIFARHARTQQARIQVELAQLQYALPRLTRLWEHLGRQVGGIGTRGPGETQLEVDRRRIRQRMAALRRKLKKVGQRRETLRNSRNGQPTAAIIGYTNAGKSTLMQQLTGADVLVRNQLFATLDTTTRRFATERHGDIFLIDTVGFIRKLPNHLVTSFEATLEDTAQADLFLHVVDCSHHAFEDQMEVTDATIRTIEHEATDLVYVFNKIDLIDDETIQGLRDRFPDAVFVSAAEGKGMDALQARMEKIFFGDNVRVEVKIPAGDGRGIARIREILHDVVDDYDEDTCVLNGTIESGKMGNLESVAGAEIRYLM
jgi:GTP-binding protein HflX